MRSPQDELTFDGSEKHSDPAVLVSRIELGLTGSFPVSLCYQQVSSTVITQSGGCSR